MLCIIEKVSRKNEPSVYTPNTTFYTYMHDINKYCIFMLFFWQIFSENLITTKRHLHSNMSVKNLKMWTHNCRWHNLSILMSCRTPGYKQRTEVFACGIDLKSVEFHIILIFVYLKIIDFLKIKIRNIEYITLT